MSSPGVSQDEDAHVDVVALDGQEVIVQSEPACKKRYRPLSDKTPDEYRKHRDRNNEAVRRCRERHQQRSKDRVGQIEGLKADRAQAVTQAEQLTDENRLLHEELRRCNEEKCALQAELCRQLTVRKRLEDNCAYMQKALEDHGVRVGMSACVSDENGVYRSSSASLSRIVSAAAAVATAPALVQRGPSTLSPSSGKGIVTGIMTTGQAVLALEQDMGVAEVVLLQSAGSEGINSSAVAAAGHAPVPHSPD